MKDVIGNCEAELGALTQAMKAQTALAQAAIPSTVVKIESSSSRRGCSYALRFSCSQERNARSVLSSARIAVKSWRENDDLS